MLDLRLLPGEYTVCRLPAGSSLPAGLDPANGGTAPGGTAPGSVVSMTWTPDEVSILCRSELAPPGADTNTPWRCFRAGPVNLAQTGVLAAIVAPLAAARVNIFAFSTHDTDYVLVPTVRLEEAMAALEAAGFRVSG